MILVSTRHVRRGIGNEGWKSVLLDGFFRSAPFFWEEVVRVVVQSRSLRTGMLTLRLRGKSRLEPSFKPGRDRKRE